MHIRRRGRVYRGRNQDENPHHGRRGGGRPGPDRHRLGHRRITTDAAAGTATLTGTTVRLSADAAAALDKAFGTDAIKGGTTVGIATIVVNLPGKGGSAASMPGAMPAGGAQTGGGSTAGGGVDPALLAGGVLTLAVAGGALVVVRRRRAADRG